MGAAAEPAIGGATPAAPAPRRILHVVSGLERGGIETALLQMLHIIDRERYHMDFLVLSARPAARESRSQEPRSQEDEAQALGSRVIWCPGYRRPWHFTRRFADILRRGAPYDVVHSHTHFYGGYVLKLAARHGVPLRIAHSRNDTRVAEAGLGWRRRAYVRLMRHWICTHANIRMAISRSAAEDLFGPRWQEEGCALIPSGRDFAPYVQPASPAATRTALRAELGLPGDAFVLGHVGRFYWRKNHPFVIAVAAELFGREPLARLLLVGDGPDQGEIEDLVRARGLAGRTVFAGARADVPRLVTGAMDAFIFPSHHEGLGLAAVEAQAAGLPCVISDALPEEIDVVPDLVHRLPLAVGPGVWAEQLLAAADAPRPTPDEAWRTVQGSDFALEKTVARLLRFYDREERPAATVADERRRWA